MDFCHQFCKATQDEAIIPFLPSKGNYVTLLNLPEQIARFGPLQDYWDGSQEHSIQLVKQNLVNMHWTQTFMSCKLTEVHQSNVLDWTMHNLDPPAMNSSNPRNGLFYTYSSIGATDKNLKTGKIICGYHHPQYPNHVIMAYSQVDKMMGVVELQVNIGVDEQYESGMYYC